MPIFFVKPLKLQMKVCTSLTSWWFYLRSIVVVYRGNTIITVIVQILLDLLLGLSWNTHIHISIWIWAHGRPKEEGITERLQFTDPRSFTNHRSISCSHLICQHYCDQIFAKLLLMMLPRVYMCVCSQHLNIVNILLLFPQRSFQESHLLLWYQLTSSPRWPPRAVSISAIFIRW